ncbi:MAG TPA: hypothetical protein VFC68_07925, partial [Treponemataceae bacterium]|nr:hypothetical protein [Treponemataceae bacterium]
MKKVSLVKIFKAQVSNTAAEECFAISIPAFISLLLVSIMMISFGFVRSRVQEGMTMSSPNLYPSFGGVLQDIAGKTGDFNVQNGELYMSFNYPRRFESNGWLVVVADDEPATVLDNEQTAAYQPMLILGQNALVISQPATNVVLQGDYRFLGFFSTDELRKITHNVQDMLTYTQAFLFAAATGAIPSSIVAMVLLMGVQYLIFILVAGLLLSVTHRSAMENTDFWRRTTFYSSVKIITVLGCGPAFLLAIISYFKPSIGVTFGWLF